MAEMTRPVSTIARVGAAENKALVVRFYEEVWNRGNGSFAREVFAAEYVRHDLRPTDPPPGPDGQAMIAEQFRLAFPDLEWTVDLVLGEGDLVAARWTAAGTQSGAWGDVEATGKRVRFSGVNIFRFGGGGKVIEIWNHRDDLGLMEQLGASFFAGATPSGASTDT
jgi:predicted ester cyclase